jgi:hypothetical protein
MMERGKAREEERRDCTALQGSALVVTGQEKKEEGRRGEEGMYQHSNTHHTPHVAHNTHQHTTHPHRAIKKEAPLWRKEGKKLKT